MSSDSTQKTPYISMCAGYDGIGLGLKRAIPALRTIAYVEREMFAVGNLVKKVEAGLLDSAPVFTDVTTFPYRAFRGIMDRGIVSAGFPCQPVSMAGKRKATEDERWLFDILCDGYELMQPGIILFENVEGLLSAKMPDGELVIAHIVTRLEKMAYRVEVGLFSASEVGAPHQRKRVFILAVRGDIAVGQADGECEGSQGGTGKQANCGRIQRSSRRGGVDELAHDLGQRIQELGDGIAGGEFLAAAGDDGTPRWPSRPGERQHCWEPPRTTRGVALGDAPDEGRAERWDRAMGESAGAEPELERPCGGRGENPERQAQPPVGRDLDGSADRMDPALLHRSTDNRVDELRLLGNGVVPETAYKAIVTLGRRAGLPWLVGGTFGA